jgi:hypothetical protein
MIALSSWQESLLSYEYSNVSYDCSHAGRYLQYATCPENGDILPGDVFNYVTYTWHYKPEVHQINLHRLHTLRSCIVIWLICYPLFYGEVVRKTSTLQTAIEMTVALIWTFDVLVMRTGIIFDGGFVIILSRGCLSVYIPPVFQIMPCRIM